MADDKPKPIPRKTPNKRSGPSMREQIAARRAAEETGGAKPAAKPAAAKPARKAAAPKAAAPKSERPARASSRTSARRAGAGRAAKADDDEEAGEGRRSRRARPEPKKKSPLPLIAAAVVAIGGVGGYFLYTGSQSEASETDGGESADTDTANADGQTPEDGATTPDGEGTDGATTEDGDAEGGATPEAAEPEDKPAPKPKKAGLVGKTTEELVAMVAALEPFGKPADISDEKWAEMSADADLVFDDGAGAASGRAEKRLGEDGNKYAWPLMINRMAKIDFTDEWQVQSGMAAQRVMQMSRGSKNLGGMGWMTAAETEDGVFGDRAHRKDLMIIIAAHRSWSSALEDPEWWPTKLYKGEMYKEAEAMKKARIEGELEGLDGLDDLDLDDMDLDDGE